MLKGKLSIGRNDLILCVASATLTTGGPAVIFQNPRQCCLLFGSLNEACIDEKMCPCSSQLEVVILSTFFVVVTNTILGRD